VCDRRRLRMCRPPARPRLGAIGHGTGQQRRPWRCRSVAGCWPVWSAGTAPTTWPRSAVAVSHLRPAPCARCLVLDGCELPGNLGSLVRCADAVGACAVIVTACQVRLSHLLVLKASMGTVFSVPVCAAKPGEALAWLRAQFSPPSSRAFQPHVAYQRWFSSICTAPTRSLPACHPATHPPAKRTSRAALQPWSMKACPNRPYGRASNTALKGVAATRRNCVKPAAVTTSRILASPAWAPSARPTSCDSEHGVHKSVEKA